MNHQVICGIDATENLPTSLESFRNRTPLIKMDEAVKAKVGKLFNL
jgi:hypothetical protein